MKPLQGKRVIITRAPDKAAAFADQLRALGAEPLILPLIQIVPVADTAELDAALHDAYDWAIFTSANAVQQVGERLKVLSPLPDWPPRIAAVGTATAAALESLGYQADCIPAEHTAEGLLTALSESSSLAGLRIFLPQGDLARPYLREGLMAAGAQVTAVIAYRNVRPPLDRAFFARPFDAITFTSPSAVSHFADLFDNPRKNLGAARVVCIGPVTAQAATEAGLPVHAIAEPHTSEGLITALCHVL